MRIPPLRPQSLHSSFLSIVFVSLIPGYLSFISPPLSAGHKLSVVLDGQQVGEPLTSTTFTLKGIYRGAHNIAIEVIDKNNNALSQSNSVKFYMKRPRVNMTRIKLKKLEPAGPSIGVQIVNLIADILLPPPVA